MQTIKQPKTKAKIRSPKRKHEEVDDEETLVVDTEAEGEETLVGGVDDEDEYEDDDLLVAPPSPKKQRRSGGGRKKKPQNKVHKQFPCDSCDKSYATKESLRKHTREKHESNKTYICGGCNGEYCSPDSLRMHHMAHEECKNTTTEIISAPVVSSTTTSTATPAAPGLPLGVSVQEAQSALNSQNSWSAWDPNKPVGQSFQGSIRTVGIDVEAMGQDASAMRGETPNSSLFAAIAGLRMAGMKVTSALDPNATQCAATVGVALEQAIFDSELEAAAAAAEQVVENEEEQDVTATAEQAVENYERKDVTATGNAAKDLMPDKASQRVAVSDDCSRGPGGKPQHVEITEDQDSEDEFLLDDPSDDDEEYRSPHSFNGASFTKWKSWDFVHYDAVAIAKELLCKREKYFWIDDNGRIRTRYERINKFWLWFCSLSSILQEDVLKCMLASFGPDLCARLKEKNAPLDIEDADELLTSIKSLRFKTYPGGYLIADLKTRGKYNGESGHVLSRMSGHMSSNVQDKLHMRIQEDRDRFEAYRLFDDTYQVFKDDRPKREAVETLSMAIFNNWFDEEKYNKMPVRPTDESLGFRILVSKRFYQKVAARAMEIYDNLEEEVVPHLELLAEEFGISLRLTKEIAGDLMNHGFPVSKWVGARTKNGTLTLGRMRELSDAFEKGGLRGLKVEWMRTRVNTRLFTLSNLLDLEPTEVPDEHLCLEDQLHSHMKFIVGLPRITISRDLSHTVRELRADRVDILRSAVKQICQLLQVKTVNIGDFGRVPFTSGASILKVIVKKLCDSNDLTGSYKKFRKGTGFFKVWVSLDGTSVEDIEGPDLDINMFPPRVLERLDLSRQDQYIVNFQHFFPLIHQIWHDNLPIRAKSKADAFHMEKLIGFAEYPRPTQMKRDKENLEKAWKATFGTEAPLLEEFLSPSSRVLASTFRGYIAYNNWKYEEDEEKQNVKETEFYMQAPTLTPLLTPLNDANLRIILREREDMATQLLLAQEEIVRLRAYKTTYD